MAPETAAVEPWTHAFPREDAKRATLLFTHGVAPRVTVRAASLPKDDLARCRFSSPEPRVVARRGELSVSYHGFLRWLLAGRAYPADVELNDTLPWTIEIEGGVARAEFDLRQADLTRFEIGGGAAHLRIRLGTPKANVPIRIRAGAAHVDVTHPPGVPARVRVASGATHLRLGAQELGAIGGRTALETPGYDAQAPGYDVSVAGGAAHLSVTEEDRQR